jgi:hypothetical protein
MEKKKNRGCYPSKKKSANKNPVHFLFGASFFPLGQNKTPRKGEEK